MIFSYLWLNNFFKGALPPVEKLSDILSYNISEVDEVSKSQNGETILDVKILPNLAHNCLAHRGLARFIGAKIDLPVSKTSRESITFKTDKTKHQISVEIEDGKDCRRYIGRVIENIKIGPSPEWLKKSLETVGQRSINNVVDATNFVLLELGQPMHAFDADKLVYRGDKIVIDVKRASEGMKMTTLDGRGIDLDPSVLIIGNEDRPLAVAGVKGGLEAEVNDETLNLVLESANFQPSLIRRTAQKVKIQTDATKRYENDLSPETAEEAMDLLTKIIMEVAGTSGTRIGEVVDNYPRRASPYKIGVTLTNINDLLDLSLTSGEVENIFSRLGFTFEKSTPVEKVISLTSEIVGKPYRLGASVSYDAPREFDCSSMTAYLYTQAGVAIPRISVDQYVYGKPVTEKEMLPGDLIFANTGEGKNFTESIEFMKGSKVPQPIDHVGLYLGNGEVLQATRYKNGVVKESLKDSEQFQNTSGIARMVENSERYIVTVPAERVDLRIKEDLIEDVAMIYGYQNIKEKDAYKGDFKTLVNKNYYFASLIRETLSNLGFSEIYTYAFTPKGEVELMNPLNVEIPFLRNNLTEPIKKSLEFNARNAELINMPQIKVFEIGKVFPISGEYTSVSLGIKTPIGVKGLPKEKDVLDEAIKKIEEIFGNTLVITTREDNIVEFDLVKTVANLTTPETYKVFSNVAEDNTRFRKISVYPFMTRDVAVFVPENIQETELRKLISIKAGDLLVSIRLFDVFRKPQADGSIKVSYAYRLVFQSYEKTLSDEEMNVVMTEVNNELNLHEGWQVR